ncbi:MAG: ABC transporter substrate-binding protein [Acidiferrobacter sp.]
MAKTIRIRIGHQLMCTDTYPGGIIIKKLHLLQKYLPHTGRYKGVKYDVVWRNYGSGAPITNMMIAGKLDIGVMGDYPLVVNGVKFQQTRNERSLLVTGTAYNLDGAGNGIVVPVHSNVYSVTQLKGKTISVPIGSAAWGMLFKMAQDKGLKMGDFEIENQGPMAGITSIALNKVAAHADFCPMSEYMEYKGTGRMIYSGAETKVPYLHGAVVRASFAKRYPQLVVAYIEAVIAADRWIQSDPQRASTMMAHWTMMPKEVLYLYYSKGGYLTPDPTLKPLWVRTLKFDHSILAKYAHMGPLNFKQWVSSRYIRAAYKRLGLNYQKQLRTIYNPLENRNLPPEIWPKKGAIIRYPSVAAMLKAAAVMTAAHKTVDATYVYDARTGMKLFGNVAFYVRLKSGRVLAFMRRGEALRFAHAQGGAVMGYEQVLAAVRRI